MPRHGEGDAVFLTKGVLCSRDGGAVPQEKVVLCPQEVEYCALEKGMLCQCKQRAGRVVSRLL